MFKIIDDAQDEVVSREAPQWAWDIIDETLSMDAKSSAFDKSLRDEIRRAFEAMIHCSEDYPGTETLSKSNPVLDE